MTTTATTTSPTVTPTLLLSERSSLAANQPTCYIAKTRVQM